MNTKYNLGEIKKQPDHPTTIYLQSVLMPNGDIIHCGRR